MSRVEDAIKNFVFAFIGGAAVVLIGLFVWFFINDAPAQIKRIKEDAQKEVAKAEDTSKHLQAEIDSLNAQLASLTAKGLFIDCVKVPIEITMPPSGPAHVIFV